MGKQVKKFGKSALSVLLAVCLAIPTSLAFPTKAQAATNGFVTPEGLYLISSKEYAIAPGIKETQVITNTANGKDQEAGYAVTVDLSNDTVSLGAGYANNDGTTWGMQTVRGQAYAAEKANGYNVVAAVNADFFNMATGAPQGALVMNGTVYHNSSNPYFAILNDGTAVIRQGKVKSDVKEAVGGSAIILVDGEVPQNFKDAYYVQKEPRTAVGIKADGSVVLFVGDGRQYPYSNGLTIFELANMMKAFGCVTAMNLDGGGSTTFLTEREGSDDLVCQNSPSDGAERTVSSSLFVYSTAKSDGKFNHAVLLPNSDAYTPYATVKFTATGVDAAGGQAQLPADVTYALASESADMGTITADGSFASNGTEGTVKVNLLSAGEVVGTTEVVVIAPDSVSFANEEVSMGFSQTSDLGLTVKANGRDIIYNTDDFVWTLSDPSMGTFNGNIFTSSDSATVTGTITCAYKYNTAVSGSVTAIIGKLPTVVWDFENPEEYTGLYTSNYGRGSVESVEVVSIDDDEPVRFGQRSLKLNYNFIDCGAVTEGACVGMTESYEIPGVPTGIGVWVYAPEGTAPTAKQKEQGISGFWLRGYFNDGSGRQQAFDYTLEPKQCTDGQEAGIYWEGWKYCEADLTKYTAPYSIQPGMTFRLMFVNGTKMGTRTAGAIYFDNLQFVYGANVDDIDAPVIDTIRGNDVDITDGMVFDTNTITFTSTFHDVENKYTSGIDYDVVRMYIDGVNVVENSNYVLDKGGNKSWYYDVELANGTHSVKMLLRDEFGNETTETRYFTVDAAENEATTMTIVPKNGSVPTLGKTFVLTLTASDVADIKSAECGIKFDDNFKVKKVSYGKGFTGNYEVKNKVLNISVEGTATTDSNVVATITFTVPKTLSQGIDFTYYTTYGSFETVSESGKSNSFSVANAKYEVIAPLVIEAENFVVGKSGKIVVKTYEGQPVAGATVYNVTDGSVELGVTDENGVLVTDAFSAASGKYTVSAALDKDISFNTYVYCLNSSASDGKPFNVLSHAAVNGNTSKSLTWEVSSTDEAGKAFAKIAVASEYAKNGEDAFKLYEGTTVDRTFTGSNAAGYTLTRINKVLATDLVPGTKYVYCVGDGNEWSDVREFTTDAVDDSVNFFIIGDIQAKDLTNNSTVIKGILNKGLNYSFGMQTGDAVDNGGSYPYWDELLKCYADNGLQDIDMVHVLGNHEYEGDATADAAYDYYNLPNRDYYSVEYDNVYIAVINYKSADNDKLAATAQWLIEDAQKSNAQWKILAMHQPPYYTNIAGGGKFINENLPKAIEEAGINMVFSGHDHTLARTMPLKGGEVDEENGVVYYICGSTGEKSYAAFNTPEFHFAYTNDSFDAVYTTVQVTDEYIKVVNYDLDGSILDTYTMESECGKNGHEYIYDGTKLVCEKCHKETDVKSYIGFAKDAETGKKMYLYLGTVKTGVVETSDGEYVFDENGLAIDGEYTIDRLKYVLEDGKVVDKNGFVEYVYEKTHKHQLRMYLNGKMVQDTGWYQYEGVWYYVEGTSVACKNMAIDGVVYLFNADGSHTEGTLKLRGKVTRYYFAGKMQTGLQKIKDNYYFFDLNDGAMVKNKVMKIDGFKYTFGPNGYATEVEEIPAKPSTGFWSYEGITCYYKDGVMVVSDWVEEEGKQYYFDEAGQMVTEASVIDGYVCSFNEDGSLAEKKLISEYSGFLTLTDGTFYYENGSRVTGWKNVDGSWYYFNESGVMNRGNKTIGGVYYKFNSDGSLAGGTFKTIKSGTRYYVAGSYVVGIYTIEGKDYFFNSNGYLVKNGTVEYMDYIYTTDENGMIVGKEAKPTRPATGFWTEDGHTYYYVEDVMVTSTWVEVEGKQYYFDVNGYMVTKESVIDNALCTFNADGSLATREELGSYNGFLTLEGNTYFYENGTKAVGWKNISDNWYYFFESGVMNRGNKTIDKIYYVFNADGTLAHGTWKTVKGKDRYYVAGESVKGLQTIDGIIRYFDGNGNKVTNTTVVVDGVTYIFDADGVGSVYVEEPAPEVPEEPETPEAPAVEENGEETVSGNEEAETVSEE